MIVARNKQHCFTTTVTKEILPIDENYEAIKSTMNDAGVVIQEKYRNGHLLERYEILGSGRIHYTKEDEDQAMYQYELFFKPQSKHKEWIDKFNEWLEKEQPGSYYQWNFVYKRNDGRKPNKYNCWCSAIGEFLVSNNFQPTLWENDGLGNGGTEVSIKK